MSDLKRKWYGDDLISKIRKYCDYQERCHKDVRFKLISHGVFGMELENTIVELVRDGYLNEERFSAGYVRGKFYINKWSKGKIVYGLKKREISDYLVKKSLSQILEEDYLALIGKLIRLKIGKAKKGTGGYKLKSTVIGYMRQKGFKYDEYRLELDNQIGLI